MAGKILVAAQRIAEKPFMLAIGLVADFWAVETAGHMDEFMLELLPTQRGLCRLARQRKDTLDIFRHDDKRVEVERPILLDLDQFQAKRPNLPQRRMHARRRKRHGKKISLTIDSILL